MKEEIVAGAHGLEARYPFLDPRVVQEFLWLAPETKNSIYKAPVAKYLDAHAYPRQEGKQGFSASKNLFVEGALRVTPIEEAAPEGFPERFL